MEPYPGMKNAPASSVYDPALPLPSAVQMEQCVLSCLLQAPEFALEAIGTRLRAEHFSLEAHSLLFDIILAQSNAAKPVDPVAITQVLYDRGLIGKVVGPAFVTDIFTASPNPSHAAYYGEIVIEKWRQRQFVLKTMAATNTVMTGQLDPATGLNGVIEDLESALMVLSQQKLHTTHGERSGENVLLETIDSLIVRHRHKGKILGLQFGFADLDRRVNGFQKEDFIVLGARAAMGKTCMATSIAERVALDAINNGNRPVYMFTLEMSDRQIMERSLLGRARIGLTKGRTGMFTDAEASVLYAARKSLAATRGQPLEFRTAHLAGDALEGWEAYAIKKGLPDRMKKGEWQDYLKDGGVAVQRFAASVAAIASGTLSFYDGYGVSVQELRTAIRQWVRRIGWDRTGEEMAPPLVIVDYLQLVKPSLKKNAGDPRLTSIEVCEALKGLAKELGIIIMGLAQVKVNAKRPEAEPDLYDLKESGSYAEYADYAFMIHRQAYYRKWHTLTEEKQKEWKDRADDKANDEVRLAAGISQDDWCGQVWYEAHGQILIRKARHCATEDVNVWFDGPGVRFLGITGKLYSNNPGEREHRAPSAPAQQAYMGDDFLND